MSVAAKFCAATEIRNFLFFFLISTHSPHSWLKSVFIRVVIICGSRVSAWLTILSHALYKLLTWKSLRHVVTSCCNICRQTVTYPSPSDTCSLLPSPHCYLPRVFVGQLALLKRLADKNTLYFPC